MTGLAACALSHSSARSVFLFDVPGSGDGDAPVSEIHLPPLSPMWGAVWNEGELFVVDCSGDGDRVCVLDIDGKVLRTWFPEGSGERHGWPCSIAIDGDRVFVADYGNNRVQVFSLQGAFMAALPVARPEDLVARNGVLAVTSYEGDSSWTIHRWCVKGMF